VRDRSPHRRRDWQREIQRERGLDHGGGREGGDSNFVPGELGTPRSRSKNAPLKAQVCVCVYLCVCHKYVYASIYVCVTSMCVTTQGRAGSKDIWWQVVANIRVAKCHLYAHTHTCTHWAKCLAEGSSVYCMCVYINCTHTHTYTHTHTHTHTGSARARSGASGGSQYPRCQRRSEREFPGTDAVSPNFLLHFPVTVPHARGRQSRSQPKP
jgi:hypothetical protein